MEMARKNIVILTMLMGLLAVSAGERCEPCPPGMYRKAVCLEGFPNSTVCEICASGTFLPRPNMAEGCFVHKVCDKPNMMTKSQGNRTHDTVCGCEEGYHMEHGSCSRNEYCPPGEGITDDGQRCESCSNGTYSDKLSNEELCLPWTNCSEYGSDVVLEGSAFSDRLCLGKGIKDTNTTLFTTVSSMEEPTSSMHVINAITLPTTSTIVLIAVAIVGSLVGLPGIYTLVIRKECKHCKQKRQGIHEMQVEDAILVLGGPNMPEVMANPVECEEDSFNTNPKVRQASSNSLDQGDSRWLLHSESNNHLQSSWDMPTSAVTDSAFENLTVEREGEEPVAEEESHLPHPIPIEIPPMPPEDPLDSPVASTIASSRQTSDSSLAYRQEGVDFVLDIFGKELTSRQVEQLAAELEQDLPYVAQRLGLEQSQVDHALNDYKPDIQEQVRVMLRNWQEQRTGDATIADLKAALIECNREELCRRLLCLSNAAEN